MCNGHSTRVSAGGSIAVLRRTSSLPHQQLHPAADEMTLLFHNQFAARGTSVELAGWNREVEGEGEGVRSWVVIHRDGDLSAPLATMQSPPFYSFSLHQSEASSPQYLSQTLDLGVGERGIIGRRVSVMTGSRAGPVMVAEGVIGWN